MVDKVWPQRPSLSFSSVHWPLIYCSFSLQTTVYISLSFTVKEDHKLFWEENVGHIKISFKPDEAKHSRDEWETLQ